MTILSKKAFLLLFCTLFSSVLFAQDAIRTCGTDAHMEQLLQDEDYKRLHEEATEQRLQLNQNAVDPQFRQDMACSSTIILPMAIHYQGLPSSYNAGCLRALALEAVEALNEDYNALNSDISNWSSVASSFSINGPGESCVEFCLATQNHPAGYGLSNGDYAITYNATSGDQVSAWSGYINIFITDLEDDELGYSPLPGSGNGDGVVIDRDYFSRGGGCATSGVSPTFPFNLNRTLTHELGHYLNLPHVWGNGGCVSDDGISDTPSQSIPYYGCASLGASTTSCSSQDMFMNYMDYANDACMYLMTPGQAQVVYTRANTLSNILHSHTIVCASPTPPVASFTVGNTSICPGGTVTLSSTSTNSPSSLSWTFSGAGVSPTSSTSATPSITVSSSGTVTATLNASNSAGNDSETQSISITVLPANDPACSSTTPPCTSFTGGPYNNQGDLDVAGCTGAFVEANYLAWANEIYFSEVQAGGNYTFDICDGYSATTWGGDAEITVIEGGTIDVTDVIGGTVLAVATGCSVSFTATTDGIILLIIALSGDCGGAVIETGNGLPTLTTNSGVSCGGCPDTVCDVGEDYCTCPTDCPCDDLAVFIDLTTDPDTPTGSATPFAYCEDFILVNGENPNPEVLYVPVAVSGQDCLTYDISSTHGTLYGSDVTGNFAPITTIPNLTIAWLQIIQADIDASGGNTTITFDGDNGNCVSSLSINWASVTNYASSVAATCPSAAAPTTLITCWLEGAWDTGTEQMTLLRTAEIPLIQPFNRPPWNYGGNETVTSMPANITDWVLIELLNGTATIETKVGLLGNNSVVYDLTGANNISFSNSGTYNVIIRSYNHLDAITANPVAIPGTVDFTDAANVMMGTNQLKQLATNEWGLYAGDATGDGVINVFDFNAYAFELNGVNDYYQADFDLDGNVSVNDFNTYLLNSTVIGISEIRY